MNIKQIKRIAKTLQTIDILILETGNQKSSYLLELMESRRLLFSIIQNNGFELDQNYKVKMKRMK